MLRKCWTHRQLGRFTLISIRQLRPAYRGRLDFQAKVDHVAISKCISIAASQTTIVIHNVQTYVAYRECGSHTSRTAHHTSGETIPQHSTSPSTITQLEELGSTMGGRRRTGLLLQYRDSICRRASMLVVIIRAMQVHWSLTFNADAQHAPPESSRDTETYPTIEAEVEQRRSKAQTQPQLSPEPSETVAIVPDAEAAIPGSPEGLEEEASQQGAFNEETGEINWECPCLGGMAHGPCGDQFRAAFSCFVFSKDEPKGVDCIEHFKTMQNCFRDHPEIYGSELEDEELEMQAELDGREAPLPASAEPVAASVSAAAPSASTSDLGATHGKKVENGPADSPAVVAGKRERAEEARQQVANDHGVQSETGNLVPKAAHDAT